MHHLKFDGNKLKTETLTKYHVTKSCYGQNSNLKNGSPIFTFLLALFWSQPTPEEISGWQSAKCENCVPIGKKNKKKKPAACMPAQLPIYCIHVMM